MQKFPSLNMWVYVGLYNDFLLVYNIVKCVLTITTQISLNQILNIYTKDLGLSCFHLKYTKII